MVSFSCFQTNSTSFAGYRPLLNFFIILVDLLLITNYYTRRLVLHLLIPMILIRFVEGDFDTYVTQIREPHVWGGEPELFMASHVLQ